MIKILIKPKLDKLFIFHKEDIKCTCHLYKLKKSFVAS